MAYLPPLRLRRRLASAPRTMIASYCGLAEVSEDVCINFQSRGINTARASPAVKQHLLLSAGSEAFACFGWYLLKDIAVPQGVASAVLRSSN